MNSHNAQVGMLIILSLMINIAFADKAKFVSYKIVNCNGAVTNIYANPTIHSEKIASIPAYAKGIKSRSKKKKYGSRYWQKVTWKSTMGWVFANRLKQDSTVTELAKSK